MALEQIIPLQQRNGLAKGYVPQSSSSMIGFHALANVILAFTNANTDGRILVVPNSGKSHRWIYQVCNVECCQALCGGVTVSHKILYKIG
jgi:hypothetical protein